MGNSSEARADTITILEEVFADASSRRFAIRLWDGSMWPADQTQPPTFTTVLNHPGALRSMFLPLSELSLGQAYIYGDIDVEGDLTAAFRVADHIRGLKLGVADQLRLKRRLCRLPCAGATRDGRQCASLTGALHSRDRDRQAISYHYDVSNEFYELWLDRRMVYSCAYFVDRDESLDTAQERKLDHICRKLRLQPGERLLDIGCGWGGLVIHAARHYGASALGTTLSRRQADLARERIRQAGLSDRCRVELLDYREILPDVLFDKLASVGMSEHVGGDKLPLFFNQAWSLLRPGGLFLHHAIACPGTEPRPKMDRNTFTKRYVFPDGELIPIGTSLQTAETVGFEVRDVESLREHYAMTLRHWARRLESRHENALRHVDETTYRTWRLYMSGSALGFDEGRFNVYQSLLAKPDRGGRVRLPLTRDDLYRAHPRRPVLRQASA